MCCASECSTTPLSGDGFHMAETIPLNGDVRSCVNHSLRKGRMCISPETCVELRVDEAEGREALPFDVSFKTSNMNKKVL